MQDHESERPLVEAKFLPALRRAFEQSSAHGLIHLGNAFQEVALPNTLAYWREFATRYLSALRMNSLEENDVAMQLVPPHRESWGDFINQAPPGRGMEYLSEAVLDDLWSEMDGVVSAEGATHSEGLRGWLRDSNPLLHLVGRVSFHLAENKRDERRPFAFIATYSHSLSKSERLQYVPLSNALKQYAGERNKSALENLLGPVEEAAKQSAVVRELVDSRRLFQPLAWSPSQAHRFICDIPAMEASGLVVRLPDWWKAKRPNRPKVKVSVGENRTGMGGLDAMLDFSVRIVLDGEEITEDELLELLGSEGDLVRLKGQ